MYRWTAVLLLAAACGGSSISATLSGPGSFSPNGALAVRALLADGGVETDFAFIALASSTPAASCGRIDAGFPDSGVVEGEVDLYVEEIGGIQPGTFNITDPNTFEQDVNGSPEAFVGLSGPTSPPSISSLGISTSVSGTLTLTKTGDDWAGTFTATMVNEADGGQEPLSGSFDTAMVCVVPLN